MAAPEQSAFDSYGFLDSAALDEASDFRCHNYK
jgi:hypothetical protein